MAGRPYARMNRAAHGRCLAVLVAALMAWPGVVRAQDGSGRATDLAWTARLFELGLTDPTGMTWVEVQSGMGWRWGWLAAGEERVHFLEQDDWCPAPSPEHRRARTPAFVDEARMIDAVPVPADARELAFALARAPGTELPGPPIAARIAWLERLGERELASRLAQKAAPLVAALRDRPLATLDDAFAGLARDAFDGAVFAFRDGADAKALRHAERLAKRYPASLDTWGPGGALVADLRRRVAAGTADPPVLSALPAEVRDWTVERRTAWLVEQLDQCQLPMSSHGGLVADDDWRFQALIGVGEAAVPSLIDTLERDERLTRSIWIPYPPPGSPKPQERWVFPVRELAYWAVTKILRTDYFTRAINDGGSADPKAKAMRVRAYWTKYGDRPYLQRMYDIVCDASEAPQAWLDAAKNLSSGMSGPWDDRTGLPGAAAQGQRPPTDAFRVGGPTVAEAMLRAMERHLARPFANDVDRRRVQRVYLDAIYATGDVRILPELAARARDPRVRLNDRFELAHRCFHRGVTEPLDELALVFGAGTLDPALAADTDAVGAIVHILGAAGSAAADRALEALSAPTHPAFACVRATIVAGPQARSDRGFFAHRYCLAVLRRALDDPAESGETYRLVGGEIPVGPNVPWHLIRALAGLELREHVAGRRCDAAALVVSNLLIGSPAYHPLLRDADARLDALRRLLDRHAADAVPVDRYGFFAPRFPALAGPATPDDVAAGRAVFSSNGAGRPAPAGTLLPAVSRLRRSEPWEHPYVWLVQAELSPDGKLVYGALFFYGRRAIPRDQLDEVTDPRR